MAKRLGLATGLHVTLTCEWEYLRWGPLTAGASLRDADGLFKRTVAEALEGDPDDAVVEVNAQIDRAQACGLELSYVDPHMGVSLVPAYEAACARLGVKFMYPMINPHHDWDVGDRPQHGAAPGPYGVVGRQARAAHARARTW